MAFLQIDETDNSLMVCDSFDQRAILPDLGGCWDSVNKVWKIVFTVANLEALLDAIPGLSVSSSLESKVREQISKEEKLEKIRIMSKQDVKVNFRIPGLKLQLYNYQRLGVMYAATNGVGLLLADEMGLGKTLQGIGTALFMKEHSKAKNVLVITPASLKFNWPLEIEKFTDESYVVIDGTPEERISQWMRKDAFFYIVNFELLQADLFGGKKFKEKTNETEEEKQKRLLRTSNAKKRQRILSEIKNRVWDVIIIDECFHSDTKISLWDGSKVSISKVVCNKLPVTVPAYNEDTGCFEEKMVVGWYKNSKKQCMRLLTDVGVSYPSPDHGYETDTGIRAVSELSVGDNVVVRDDMAITDKHVEVIAGMLLGDSCLYGTKMGNTAKRARIAFTHGVCQKEYAEWTASFFKGYFSTSDVENKGFGKRSVVGKSLSIIRRNTYDVFYKNGKKQISKDWMEKITPLSLAIWYMDDGSVYTPNMSKRWRVMIDFLESFKNEDSLSGLGWRKVARKLNISHYKSRVLCQYLKDKTCIEKYKKLEQQRQYISLHTEGFQKVEIDILISMLSEKFGVESNRFPCRKNGNVMWFIRLDWENSKKFLRLISKFVPECMRYKLGGLNCNEYSIDLNAKEFKIMPRAGISKIYALDLHKKPATTYNIEVEGIHRYVAGGCVVSNCHSIKNHSSARTQNVKELKAKCRIAMTGTPMDGRLEELHSIMQFVAPGLLMSKTRFFQKYVETDFWGRVTGYKRIGEVTNKIQPFFLRRLKKDVLKDLPDKVYENRVVSLTPEEQRVYKSLAENGHESTEDASAMVSIIRCKQFCNYPEMIDSTCKVNSKLEAFKEVLEEVVLQNGHKALIFSQYKEMLNVLVKELDTLGLKYMRIDGDTPPKDRATMQKQFNEDPKIDIMIGTEAMSTGLNFQSADYVINYDDNWSPAIMAQREDRCLAVNSWIGIRSDKSHCKDLVKIQNVKVGDYVFTHGGKNGYVSGIQSREHRGMTTSIDYVGWWEPLVCTYDHKIFIKRNGGLMWVEAHELLPSDSMAFPKDKFFKRMDKVVIKDSWRLFPKPTNDCIVCGEKVEARRLCRKHYREWVENNRKEINSGEKASGNGRYVRLPDSILIDDEWLKLFGWYAAEGFSSTKKGKSGFVSLSGHKDEEEVLLKFGRKFESIGVKFSIYTNKQSNGIELRAYSGELARWFMDWFGHRSVNKTLPEEIMCLPPDQSSSFLRGYTDGDGYQRGRQVEWVSASMTMCYQMCLLAIKSGFIPTMRKVVHPKTKTSHYIGAYTKFGKPPNKRLAEQDADYVYRPIRKVETKNDKLRVYDLTVDGDHSFTTGFASVHNCHRNGQRNVVTVVNFICKNTIEERIRGVIYAKNKVSSLALGDETDELVLKRLGPKDMARLL